VLEYWLRDVQSATFVLLTTMMLLLALCCSEHEARNG
jgi:hypothetical protein